ncbi:hypothetical protein [Thiomicrorhabdus sp. 6S3-12]|uniref:hypothetical protein n=1 Tax=Thiomicrorhabdus sp. 6S3-12 TaxID=2819681 RepID=UPI001AADBD6E|nr:hypothetical protein [Thiomicrorhabdus sp. 6S3-12]MBO1924582.1 hypothetical protein [Thiomicrorhabdus sp. 6S3-12]
MNIPTESYSDKFEQYSEALAWLNKIGVKFSASRIKHYHKTIEYWKDNYRDADDLEVKNEFPNFFSSLFEIYDFIEIYKAFGNEPTDNLHHIIEKLQKGVNGPIHSHDESATSTEARNFLFEALVAAKSHNPEKGIEAILDAFTDTGVSIEKTKIWIECKRIFSKKKLQANIKKASKQLISHIGRNIGTRHKGVVAIEVTKLINPANDILVAENDSKLKSYIDQTMDSFIQENSEVWETIYKTKNKKIIGTIIKFSFMASSESRNLLVHSSQWGVNPRPGISDDDKNLLIKLTNKMNER